MARELATFDLEQWIRTGEANADFEIGASGVPAADIRPYLPSKNELAKIWNTHPDKLRNQVVETIANQYRLRADEILLTQGASEADFLAPLALAGPRAHVVVEKPAYFALLEPARALGCQVSRVERSPDSFELDPGAVERALTAETRLVCLARPHNPSGDRISDQALVEIAEAAERVDAYVLVDEVFADATTEGDTPARLLHDRLLSVNSLTKCMGFGSMHLGWIAAPPPVVEQLRRAKSHVRPLNPNLILGLAARILPKRPAIVKATRARRKRNHALVGRFVHEHGIQWTKPDHGTTCVLRHPAWRDDVAFAKELLQKQRTLIAPGTHVELPGWIRLGLVVDENALKAGLEKLGRQLGAPPPSKARQGRASRRTRTIH